MDALDVAATVLQESDDTAGTMLSVALCVDELLDVVAIVITTRRQADEGSLPRISSMLW